MKKIIYLLTPPIVLKLIKRMLAYRFRPQVFSSFNEAIKWCISGGYLNQNLIDVICIRSSEMVSKISAENVVTTDSTYLIVNFSIFYSLLKKYSIIPTGGGCINIIDFGGGPCGYYFNLRHWLGQEFQINYNIVETDAMCNKARTLWNDPSLKFWTDIEDAIASLGRIDIIISSGAIQYTPDPYAIIEAMIGSAPEYILFSRCSLASGDRDLITIQEYSLSLGGRFPIPVGYKDMNVLHPHTSIQRQVFENMLSKGYQLLLKILDDNTGIVPCHGEEVVGGAYFYKRKLGS